MSLRREERGSHHAANDDLRHDSRRFPSIDQGRWFVVGYQLGPDLVEHWALEHRESGRQVVVGTLGVQEHAPRRAISTITLPDDSGAR